MLYLGICLIFLVVALAGFWFSTKSCYLRGVLCEFVKLPFSGLSSSLTDRGYGKQHPITRRPLLKVIFTPLVRWLWISEVQGLENIPGDGAYLVALNHESYFDFICFTAAVDRKVHFLAAEKFFEHPIWKRVMHVMECIRVDRSSRVNRSAIKQISKVIAKEGLVGIFPEGTRSPDGRLMRGKPGIAYIALHTGIPVIPVGLIGTFEIMSRHDRLPRLSKAIIKIGEPLLFETPEGGRNEPSHLQNVTDTIMLRIAELTGETYPCPEAYNGCDAEA